MKRKALREANPDWDSNTINDDFIIELEQALQPFVNTWNELSKVKEASSLSDYNDRTPEEHVVDGFEMISTVADDVAKVRANHHIKENVKYFDSAMGVLTISMNSLFTKDNLKYCYDASGNFNEIGMIIIHNLFGGQQIDYKTFVSGILRRINEIYQLVNNAREEVREMDNSDMTHATRHISYGMNQGNSKIYNQQILGPSPANGTLPSIDGQEPTSKAASLGNSSLKEAKKMKKNNPVLNEAKEMKNLFDRMNAIRW